jgi:hypothetical protein
MASQNELLNGTLPDVYHTYDAIDPKHFAGKLKGKVVGQ